MPSCTIWCGGWCLPRWVLLKEFAEQEVFDRLDGTNWTMLQGFAPPHGLVLVEVIYSDEAAWFPESNQVGNWRK